MNFLEDYGHLRNDPKCRKFDPDLPKRSGVFSAFQCGVCKAEREKAQEEPPKPQEEDWDKFLGTLGSPSPSGPAELDASTRASHAHYFAHFQSLQAVGFSKTEAFTLLASQLSQIAAVQARWELEQKGGA